MTRESEREREREEGGGGGWIVKKVCFKWGKLWKLIDGEKYYDKEKITRKKKKEMFRMMKVDDEHDEEAKSQWSEKRTKGRRNMKR